MVLVLAHRNLERLLAFSDFGDGLDAGPLGRSDDELIVGGYDGDDAEGQRLRKRTGATSRHRQGAGWVHHAQLHLLPHHFIEVSRGIARKQRVKPGV